jgi:hypothetical protein
MDQDLEELVARASDPRWIPAIYNYCDRRCARCRFNERCFAFNEEARESCSAEDIVDVASRSLSRSVRLLHAYAEREGIDLEAEPVGIEEEAARNEVEQDPLVAAAHEYAIESYRLLTALEAQLGAGGSVDVRDAVDSLQWLSTMIAPKIHRAISGQSDAISLEDHSTQNDSHGSAKIARLMIADSLAAWRVVNEIGRATLNSPTRSMAAQLERIDRDLGTRIPRAMEFIRPGFDEPIPGTVRPWSLTATDESSERFVAASRIMTKLKDFGRLLLPRFKRSDEL